MFRKNTLNQAIRRRLVCHMPGNEGVFSGILVDHCKAYWTFEDCKTVPSKEGETVQNIPGRIWVKHDVSPPPHLQELPT